MSKSPIRALVLFLLSLCAAERTPADVLFDSLGTNGSSSTYDSICWNVFSHGSSANTADGIAASFSVPAGGYSLTSVSLAFGYIEGTNNLAISLQADAGGHPTGIPLETIVSHPSNITSLHQIISYSSSLNPVMTGGTKYWLVAEPVDLNVLNPQNNSAYAWYWNGAFGDAGGRNFDFATEVWGNWQIFPATLLPGFRIEGFAVPEPTAFSLLLFGACLLGLRLRRKL